jgi:hypothetical protein
MAISATLIFFDLELLCCLFLSMQLLGVGVGVCVELSSLASPRLTSHHQIRTKSIVVHLIHCRRLFSAVFSGRNISEHFRLF